MRSLRLPALKSKLARFHPAHRGIARGFLTVVVFLVAAKLIALGKEVAVAVRFGTGPEVDAYMLALTVVTWLPVMLWSVASAVLVPRLVPAAAASDSGFAAELNGTMLVLCLALWPLTWAVGPLASQLLAGPKSSAWHALAFEMTAAMAAFAALTLAAGYVAIRLQVLQKQSYTLFEAMPALGVLVLLSAVPASGATAALVGGTLAGGVVQVAALLWLLVRAQGGLGGCAMRHRSSQWRALYRDMMVMGAAQALIALSTPIDQFFAARVGEGAIATLGYAARVASLPIGFATLAIGRAMLPVLSDHVARGESALARHIAVRWMTILAFVGAAGALLAWPLAEPVIALLLERGRFTAQDTEQVARALAVLLLQLPFLLPALVGVQWLASRRNYRALVGATLCALGVKLAAVTVLAPLLGVVGIAVSAVIMYAASSAVILAVLYAGREV